MQANIENYNGKIQIESEIGKGNSENRFLNMGNPNFILIDDDKIMFF
jgi:hypothetical protein